MTTPKIVGGGGGGGGAPSRKSRVADKPVVVEPTSSATNDNNNNNNNSNNNNSNNNSSSNNNNNGSTTLQKTAGVTRLPSIKERERRTSTQKKPRTSSVNEANTTTTTTTADSTTATITTITITSTTGTPLQRQDSTSTTTTASASHTSTSTTTTTTTTPRRPSLLQGPPQSLLTNKRPTFAGIGRRVSHMVRARMAFQNRRKSTTAAAVETNHMEQIHEMPRNPRFTTFLSAEAQYAVMKGYEDMLYEKISKTNPESKLVLKRNKTPFHKKISIVDLEGEMQELRAGTPVAEEDGHTGTITPAATSSTTPAPTATESETLESMDRTGNATPSIFPSPFMRKPRRTLSTVSSDVSRSLTSSRAVSETGPGGGAGFPLHRSSSLPSLASSLSHRKRLVLTYRLESAMDILDTLKRRNMENSLSPRVYRSPRQVDAVRDFNSWTKVWNKEFKVLHAK